MKPVSGCARTHVAAHSNTTIAQLNPQNFFCIRFPSCLFCCSIVDNIVHDTTGGSRAEQPLLPLSRVMVFEPCIRLLRICHRITTERGSKHV